jgi:hypothetical protein
MSTVPSGTRFIGISDRVNLTERKSAGLNADTQPYTIDDLVDTIGVGAEGPQGVEGPAGPPGPVGPAGLNWQGAWVSGTSYVADDAVGYSGASYFCILATSGTTTPNLATANWALLASQGAIGPQGAQGPTGPQGAGATQTLQQTVGLGNTVNDGTTTLTVLADSIKTNDFLGGKVEIVSTLGDNPYLKFGLPASAGKTVTLTSADTQSASRTIKLPDASGTVALTNTITLQQTFDNGGNNIVSGNFKTTLQSTGIISENTVSLSKIEIIPTQIKLIRNNGGVQQTNLYCSLTPTANRNIYLPDASGTVALTNNITLQQTVDNGNTISDSFSTQTLYPNINKFDNLVDGTTGIYGLGVFNKGDGTNFQNIELPETLTGGIKTITFPNATGTVALVDYKVYSALISQSGTGVPTAKILKNTTGATFSFGRTLAGSYTVTASSNVFTANKTASIYSLNTGGAYSNAMMNFWYIGATFFSIETLNTSTLTDGIMSDTFIEIRIYN